MGRKYEVASVGCQNIALLMIRLAAQVNVKTSFTFRPKIKKESAKRATRTHEPAKTRLSARPIANDRPD